MIRTIKDWNCMNANIRNNGSLASFKHNVFKLFLDFLAEKKSRKFSSLLFIHIQKEIHFSAIKRDKVKVLFCQK